MYTSPSPLAVNVTGPVMSTILDAVICVSPLYHPKNLPPVLFGVGNVPSAPPYVSPYVTS